jgi:hypothetical protein
MFPKSEIFEKHYRDYCTQIAKTDLSAIVDRLGLRLQGDRMLLRLFDKDYLVSGAGITDADGERPEYMVCVIIAKYILSCPDRDHNDVEWTSFKDFKNTSHFTNVNFFSSDVEQAIAKRFSGRVAELSEAAEGMGGIPDDAGASYDLALRFTALPRLSLLLLFNDGDEEFPAECKVLFERRAEMHLDPESIAMLGALLAKRLKRSTSDR